MFIKMLNHHYGPHCGEFGVSYAIKCGNDDVIAMTLDMSGDKYATLSYKINEVDYGNAFEEINIEESYSMAIRTWNPTDIQLLS